MPLSPYERQILSVVEEVLDRDDPALAAMLRDGRPPSPIRQEIPFWAGQLWVLTLVLIALAIHPLLYEFGVVGVGVLTVGLVLPWLLHAARRAAAVAEHDRSG